jgi:uncharacterized protein YmfQ (DUF2313 family)
MTTHVNVMKQILHFVWDLLDDELRTVVIVTGEFFDNIQDVMMFVKTQIIPYDSTVDGTLTDFERFYRLFPAVSDTLSMRRDRIIAAIRASGGLNISYFYRIANSFGYSIGLGSGTKYLTIAETPCKPFRAGYGRAGQDAVYANSYGSSMYTVIVFGTGVEDDVYLHSAFNKQHCAGVEILYSNV